MGNILFFIILSAAGALVLAVAYGIFEILLFILYKLDGGRLGLRSYLKKL